VTSVEDDRQCTHIWEPPATLVKYTREARSIYGELHAASAWADSHGEPADLSCKLPGTYRLHLEAF